MKFLVDAQLPRRLAYLLRDEGYDVVHTLDLLHGNHTSDAIINQVSLAEQRVVITKDYDFVDSFLLKGEPYKLLQISTGNIRNDELMRLFGLNLERIVNALEEYSYVELDREHFTIYR